MIKAVAACCICLAAPAAAQTIATATYTDPTTRYAHGVLGDAIEHAGLEVTLTDGRVMRAVWGDEMVFEDTAPRVVDLDNDGKPEVITVESHKDFGARLSVWGITDAGQLGILAANAFIGRPFRWLAVAGATDLDGDGKMEIAYVDRPHLAKTLMIWRFDRSDAQTASLTQVASFAGVTNHRIGDRDILGGLRQCPRQPPEIIVASADWSRILGVSVNGDGYSAQDLGANTGPAAVERILACEG